jgi:hypothetical protein
MASKALLYVLTGGFFLLSGISTQNAMLVANKRDRGRVFFVVCAIVSGLGFIFLGLNTK